MITLFCTDLLGLCDFIFGDAGFVARYVHESNAAAVAMGLSFFFFMAMVSIIDKGVKYAQMKNSFRIHFRYDFAVVLQRWS